MFSFLPDSQVKAVFQISQDVVGNRLDAILQKILKINRLESRRLGQEGRIRIDGRAEVIGMPRLNIGQWVEIVHDSVKPALLPEYIPLSILHENEQLFLIDKPGGMATYPGPGRPAGTLANALRGLGRSLSDLEGPWRPGIVHRLDAGTSGVMVIAKDNKTHKKLQQFFYHHEITRDYWALTMNWPTWEEYCMDAPLGRKRQGRKAYGLQIKNGRAARTFFRVLGRFRANEKQGASPENQIALIGAHPETGRTHQIRVHLAALGHPLCGDTLYGGGDRAARWAAQLGFRRTALHAIHLACKDLGFDITAPLPTDFIDVFQRLGNDAYLKQIILPTY